MIIIYLFFMVLIIFIVVWGLKKGIEIVVEVFMFMFFVMLIGIVIFVVFVGDVGVGFVFFF